MKKLLNITSVLLMLLATAILTTACGHDSDDPAYIYFPIANRTVEIAFNDAAIDQLYSIGLATNDSAHKNEITEITIPESYTIGGLTYKITKISKDAFSGCTSLKSIVIPGSVVEIEDGEDFDEDEGEQEDDVKCGAFSNCTGLESVEIQGNALRIIGDYAFYNCTSLSNINIPSGVRSIGKQSFCNCVGITALELPDTLVEIKEAAFSFCSSLASINLPEGLEIIEEEAFLDCSALTEIAIPMGITAIGEETFYNCSALTSVSIPNTVTLIDEEAFSNCTALASVDVPDSVTTIKEMSFLNVPEVRVNFARLDNQSKLLRPWGAVNAIDKSIQN